ncbi:hypothetical protein HQQ80_11465 [Microbacteriaceae bacterium VKM Ac-2855]|nr:hypothetical protein [Microbacteriaceae bacterium VKM Ac-2855]
MTPPIADRFVDAQSWWLIAETLRRHAGWGVIETFDESIGSALTVADLGSQERSQLRITRTRGLEVLPHGSLRIGWPEVFAATSRLTVIKRLENALSAPEARPSTTAVNLRFRVIAKILALTVDDRHDWTVRGERPDDPPVTASLEWAGDLSGFPSVPALKQWWWEEQSFGSLYLGGQAAWVLLRDLQPVALFDQYGDVHTSEGRFALLESYRMNGSRLMTAIGLGLGHLLP